ncbi:hypothetical protein [Mycobacterium sp.]|nr:hypothetical protein [Mycobacterium sp.]
MQPRICHTSPCLTFPLLSAGNDTAEVLESEYAQGYADAQTERRWD